MKMVALFLQINFKSYERPSVENLSFVTKQNFMHKILQVEIEVCRIVQCVKSTRKRSEEEQ